MQPVYQQGRITIISVLSFFTCACALKYFIMYLRNYSFIRHSSKLSSCMADCWFMLLNPNWQNKAFFAKNEGIKDKPEKRCKIAHTENQPLIKKMHFFLKIITKIFGQFRKKQ